MSGRPSQPALRSLSVVLAFSWEGDGATVECRPKRTFWVVRLVGTFAVGALFRRGAVPVLLFPAAAAPLYVLAWAARVKLPAPRALSWGPGRGAIH